ncbi:Beta-1,4-mannosyltransferase egh [Gracilariopsis chorda]|uniref:Beta-1,4-mannosyltransferase egh n=1 Tax=Gracilariopsis chorda TaxID=448386 RepID=A0A2V3IMN0_9FLOR|nr:Beta-1,4-mannosyltransferase egh [Gracilariopsis chorda]|eukprot:PXF42370.1 Beta-1,4-mannosyltransferase egh [Gracilariopsis chorda]
MMSMAAKPSPSAQPLLLLLRIVSGVHLLLAVLPASSSPPLVLLNGLRAPAPLHIALQVFLEGYFLAHAHPFRPSPLLSLRRLLQIWPPYMLCTVIHALCFASSTSLPALFAELVALSPFLPSNFAFPPSDAPFPAQSLLPSLAFCTLLFPTLHALLPVPHPRNRPQILYVAAVLLFVLVLQALWITNLPVYRRAFVPDLLAYVPFLTHVPTFMAGVLLSLWHTAGVPSRPRSSYAFARVILPVALLTALSTVLASSNLPPFVRALSFTALLVPLLALLVDACFIPPPFASANRHPDASASNLVRAINRLFYAAFLLALPLYRLLSHTLCTPSRVSFAFLCYESHESPRLYGAQGLFSPLPVGTAPSTTVQLAVVRAFSTSLLFEEGVNIFLFFTVLLLASWIACHLVFAPLASLAHAACNRVAVLADDQLLPPLLALLHGYGYHNPPRRQLSSTQRIVRLILYYAFACTFLILVYHFSQPITFQLVKTPRSLLCFLPNFIYECVDDAKSENSVIDMLLTYPIVILLVQVCRVVSLFIVPPMLINLIGHFTFPRSIWKALPTISQMLTAPDEEANLVEPTESELLHTTNEKNTGSKQPLDTDFVIFIRYVTRGTNPRLVATNTRRAVHVMLESRLPRHMWAIEVVTDNSLDLAEQVNDVSVKEIVVPDQYHPPNGAMYKARALNYAILASDARARDWIVHLDEETSFDVDTVRAIFYHCGTESYKTHVTKTQQWPCIGQGPIVYGRAMTDLVSSTSGNWVTTLADSNRVSDDCGRYRIQFECREAWVGMHGSFVVAANCVEQAITFDHGVDGSIAEDAFFAMLARSANVRFRWIDALMFEQSPFTIQDFVKQRSRWLVGGVRVISSSRIPIHLRLLMGSLTLLWSMMPLTYVSLIVAILFGGDTSSTWWKRVYYHELLPMMSAISMWSYVLGFMVTFSVWAVGLVRYLVLFYSQLVLTPVFGVVELSAVCYAILNYKRISTAFHVVQKDGEQVGGEEQSLL